MITGQVSLPLALSVPQRSERYTFQAGCRGFDSHLPLHESEQGNCFVISCLLGSSITLSPDICDQYSPTIAQRFGHSFDISKYYWYSWYIHDELVQRAHGIASAGLTKEAIVVQFISSSKQRVVASKIRVANLQSHPLIWEEAPLG